MTFHLNKISEEKWAIRNAAILRIVFKCKEIFPREEKIACAMTVCRLGEVVMKSWRILFVFMMAGTLAKSVAAENKCGDDGVVCAAGEICCEHVVATFAGDHPFGAPYVKGECLSQGDKCSEFWCGNRLCKPGLLGTPSVCCANTPENSASTDYSCAYTELSCPGNTQQLTIREAQPTRTLRRG